MPEQSAQAWTQIEQVALRRLRVGGWWRFSALNGNQVNVESCSIGRDRAGDRFMTEDNPRIYNV